MWPRAQGMSVSLARAVLLLVLMSATPLVSSAPAAPAGTHAGGRVIDVPAGGDLQGAIDTALPGDTIRLAAGATFDGQFTLRAKSGLEPITVRTSAPDSALPADGVRVSPAHAASMARLQSASGPIVATESGARGYRFLGLEIAPAPGTFIVNLVEIGGNNETSAAALPSDFTFDRCFLHGDPVKGSRRAIAMNGANISVRNSYLADFKEEGAWSQALAAWNGAGPFTIQNNRLEAAGMNLLFGGGVASIPGLVPSGLTIRHNHFTKSHAWMPNDPGYAGVPWIAQSHLKIENAKDVVIEGNIFEDSWGGTSNGFSVQFETSGSGGMPWAVVKDVEFKDNIVRHAGAGLSISGRDPSGAVRGADSISIVNNLFYDVNATRWNGSGVFLQGASGTVNLTLRHNTALQSENTLNAVGVASAGLRFLDNIVPHNQYGIFASGGATGSAALDTFFPNSSFAGNVIPGADPARYPNNNFYPASLLALGFADLPGGNYRLSESSQYRDKASDGRDPGADIDAIERATKGVEDGTADYVAPGPGDAGIAGIAKIAGPVILVGGIAILTVAAGIAVGTEAGKYATLSALLPLFNRIRRDRVLDHFVRGQIFEYVRSNPGVHYNLIMNRLHLGNGQVSHHLRTLEMQGFLRSNREGMYRLFYPVDVKADGREGMRMSALQLRILETLVATPRLSQSEIAVQVGVSQQAVSYNLTVLMELGFLTAGAENGTRRYAVSAKPDLMARIVPSRVDHRAGKDHPPAEPRARG